MSGLVLVDAGVLVAALDVQNASRRLRAREWIELLWRERRGRTSIHVLNEYFSFVTRKSSMKISPEDAWEDVQMFLTWSPQETDADLLARAFHLGQRFQLDWSMALVVAAAQAQGCSLLLSEQLENGATFDGVVVRDPFNLAVGEEHTAYKVAPKLSSRHRGRGRPRTRPQRASGGGT
jgi:predicted nucleic acid-binding protein